MVVIVARENAQKAIELLKAAGEPAIEIGRIEARGWVKRPRRWSFKTQRAGAPAPR